MQRNFAARKVIARAHTVCLEGLHGPRPLLRLPLARQQLGFRIEGGGDRVSHSLSLSLSLSSATPPPSAVPCRFARQTLINHCEIPGGLGERMLTNSRQS
jgi:hypothetical protein